MSVRNDVVRKSKARAREALEALMQSGKIEGKLHEYLTVCHGEDEGEGAFPNLAGFCRYLGVGLHTFCELGESYPMAYDAIMTQLEDEALNAHKLPADSAMLTAAYFKRRLGYDGETIAGKGGERVNVMFDHDIMQAGI